MTKKKQTENQGKNAKNLARAKSAGAVTEQANNLTPKQKRLAEKQGEHSSRQR